MYKVKGRYVLKDRKKRVVEDELYTGDGIYGKDGIARQYFRTWSSEDAVGTTS